MLPISEIQTNSITVVVYICNSQKETKSAYTTLKKDKSISSVEINEPLKVNKATTTKDKSEKTTEKTELGKYLDSLKPSKKVRVAILDTGLNAKEGLNVEDLGINYSSTGESTSSNDDNGHGTEMAELISANSSSVKLVPKTSHTQNELSTLKTQYYSETNMKFRQQQAF